MAESLSYSANKLKRKFLKLDWDNGKISTDTNNIGNSVYFDFIPGKWTHDSKNPDILILNFRILTACYDPENNQEEIISCLEKFPNVPILIECVTSPFAGINDIGKNLDKKPKFLENRKWAILHYTTLETIPSWATADNFIYFDMRFDQFRYYYVGNLHLEYKWEHRSLHWKKPKLFPVKEKQKKFLVINRVKPKDFELGARFHLNELVRNFSSIYTANQNHILTSDMNPEANNDYQSWYNQQSSNRLVGCLEDPTLDNFTKWNPIDNTITVDNNEKNAYIPHNWNNHPHSFYYENSYCSVFVETTETHDPLPSEKIWNPLCRGHFILPFSGCGIIKLLRNLNFEFPDFIDYSYDEIKDGEQRRTAWLSEIQRLNQLHLTQWYQKYLANIDIITHNMKNFYTYPVQDPFTKFLNE